MNSTDHLDQLWRSARNHFARLRVETLRLAVANRETRRQRVPTLVVDGINCWANFSRAYYLSAVRGCRACNGTRITAQAIPSRMPRDAIVAAVRASAKNNAQWLPATGPIDRRLEPAWHDPNVLMRSAQAVGLSNTSDILAAFSPFPSCFLDWACVRNFFAHRNGDTHASALRVLMQYGLVSTRDIPELLVRPAIRAARPLLWEWCVEVELRCEYLCY